MHPERSGSRVPRLCQLILRNLENVAETAARNEELHDGDEGNAAVFCKE